MAEKIVSPGVFTSEKDLSFLPQAVGEIGAAVIGPTAKGPAMAPTMVSNYSEYVQIFGDIVTSGSSDADKKNYSYLTNTAAKEYLKNGSALTVVRMLSGSYTAATCKVPVSASLSATEATNNYADQAIVTASFTCETLSHGVLQTSSGSISNHMLNAKGDRDNLRLEVSSVNDTKGSFTLSIRRGDDSKKRKIALESWNGVNLDPNSNNYIERVIGNQTHTIAGSGTARYVKTTGKYPNKSKYIRISSVAKATPNYLLEDGTVRLNSATGSLPTRVVTGGVWSGSFTGGSDGSAGPNSTNANWNETIDSTNVQGYDYSTLTSCEELYSAILLMGNADDYDINMLLVPGVIAGEHSALAAQILSSCEDRGDCMAILDPVKWDSNVATAAAIGDSYDSSYGAMYYPWCLTNDTSTNQLIWVPASTLMGGVFAFNDQVAHEWFAPAGLNRGGLDSAIQAERKLPHVDRDTLYEKGINPIATFPGQGVAAWGQKTLQRKASALDRVNVRRLLIRLKKFIASTSRFLVFENNTAATRNRFLSAVNPYMADVQTKQGLYAFRVVMDESNNTPDVIDRNILKGEIFLQPAKAAEFIVIDFNVLPTGATFGE
tara:strand:- start:1047 stop:2858 length:1812 start_codon:yes stop_codon:yes gene_type:complete